MAVWLEYFPHPFLFYIKEHNDKRFDLLFLLLHYDKNNTNIYAVIIQKVEINVFPHHLK